MLTVGCATSPSPVVEVIGAEQFTRVCDAPAVLSDEDIRHFSAMPAAERERLLWADRDLASRGATLCERARADALLALIARHNQIVRERGE